MLSVSREGTHPSRLILWIYFRWITEGNKIQEHPRLEGTHTELSLTPGSAQDHPNPIVWEHSPNAPRAPVWGCARCPGNLPCLRSPPLDALWQFYAFLTLWHPKLCAQKPKILLLPRVWSETLLEPLKFSVKICKSGYDLQGYKSIPWQTASAASRKSCK